MFRANCRKAERVGLQQQPVIVVDPPVDFDHFPINDCLMGKRMIESLDHLVLTVADLDATCRFYVDGLGMRWVTFGEGRNALAFGNQKINLHHVERMFEPRAACPMPGSADLCFLTERALVEVAAHMDVLGYPVLEGPVQKAGATGPIMSLYFRDPDQNLIEISKLVT